MRSPMGRWVIRESSASCSAMIGSGVNVIFILVEDISLTVKTLAYISLLVEKRLDLYYP